MNNLEAIEAWKKWAETGTHPGDTWPSEETHVDFWFANGGETANAHLLQFATTGDGSLLAVYSEAGGAFEQGPVVFLGSEGELHVLGESVLVALAVVARAGDDVLDSALSYGPEGEADESLTRWLFDNGTSAISDLSVFIAESDHRHGAVVKFINALNDVE